MQHAHLFGATLLAAITACLGCGSSTGEPAAQPGQGVDAGEVGPAEDTSPEEDATAGEEADAGPASDADAFVEADEAGDVSPDVTLPTQADPTRLADVLRALSADDMQGRLTGAPSGAKAEAYVIDQMTATGLEIATQDVSFAVYERGSPIDLSIVDADNATIESLAYISEYREILFAGSGSVTGELAFAGYGEDESFEDLDVAGKVVAVLALSPGDRKYTFDEKIHRAHEKGAIGMVFLPSGALVDYDRAVGVQYEPPAMRSAGGMYGAGYGDPDLLADDVPAVWAHVGAVSKLLGKTTDELEADPTPFASATRVHLEVHGTTYLDGVCKNVIGILRGTDPGVGGEVLGIGAHYDHIGMGGNGLPFPGAADNGSGTAAVLEAARQFGTLGVAPKRTVFFALWCGEDQGIYGSFHYRANPLLPLESTILYVNLDYLSDSTKPYFYREGSFPVQDEFVGASPDVSMKELNLGTFQCASDECPFHKAGIPFLRFLSYADTHHHKQNDTFENANLATLGMVADVVVRGVVKLAY